LAFKRQVSFQKGNACDCLKGKKAAIGRNLSSLEGNHDGGGAKSNLFVAALGRKKVEKDHRGGGETSPQVFCRGKKEGGDAGVKRVVKRLMSVGGEEILARSGSGRNTGRH